MKETPKPEPNIYRNLVIIKVVYQITTTKVNFIKKKQTERKKGRKKNDGTTI